MSNFIEIPKVNPKLLQLWSSKYGQKEAIFLIKYVSSFIDYYRSCYEKLKDGEILPFVVSKIFRNGELKKMFHPWKPETLKLILNSLQRKEILQWFGSTFKKTYVMFLSHEALAKEMMSFEEQSNV